MLQSLTLLFFITSLSTPHLMYCERTQTDGKNESVSEATGLDFCDCEPITRQEFADDCDVNHVINRYGSIPMAQRQPVYGDVDMDQSFHDAHNALHAAVEAFSQLPEGLRKAYPTPEALTGALLSGELVITKAETAVDVPSTDGSASPAAAD